jgi:hypothetical protein
MLGSRMEGVYVSPAVPYDPGEHADPVHTAAPAKRHSTGAFGGLPLFFLSGRQTKLPLLKFQ